MPSKKQRRRREKLKRHEWEFVELDEEGNETPLEPAQIRKAEQNGKPAAAKARRPLREVKPPSWNRAIRRGVPLQIGLIVLVVFVLKGSLVQRVLTAVLYAAATIPFLYWMDRTAYRTYQRRLGRS